jgi:hypothetical protein
MPDSFVRCYGLVPRGGPGLACDDDGLVLGPMPLVAVVRDAAGRRRYRLHSAVEVARALRLAYGPTRDDTVERYRRGLARVAELLAAGENARAHIFAVLLGFPEIAPEGMAKLVRAADLRKDNPDWEDEPRVPAGNPDGGQWTSDVDGIGDDGTGSADGGDDSGQDDGQNGENAEPVDAARDALCLARCSPILNRPKRLYPGDLNQWGFLNCYYACMRGVD